eukprot:comp25845_c0_seq1/m.47039 comp25845_c0_seq1/g.47039  ORF comp25845_c0_seq1/g.47039 comp25845_c0_seq1/m.47039 type:complete len:316 (-) comp25845_c0_seq1:39-986(-)
MFVTICLGLMAFSFLAYLIPVILESFVYKERNLKEVYAARWGLVTGASSGIGKALAERLAGQGVNVVLVALQNADLDNTTKELKERFPQVEMRAVGADLSGTSGDYMKPIIDATKDIDVSIIFNNAGYILTGLFADVPLEKALHNCEVNMMSAVKITHHFANELLDKKMRGLIAFTSSSSGFIPNPTSALYGSTKAFLTEFASSIAGELYPNGIDVLVVHPSPIASNFYSNAGSLSILSLVQKTAKPPSTIADCVFTCAGRTVVRDQGYFSIGNKLLLKLLDWNLLANITTVAVSTMGDYKTMKKTRTTKPLNQK